MQDLMVGKMAALPRQTWWWIRGPARSATLTITGCQRKKETFRSLLFSWVSPQQGTARSSREERWEQPRHGQRLRQPSPLGRVTEHKALLRPGLCLQIG